MNLKKCKLFIQLTTLYLAYFFFNYQFILIPYILNDEYRAIENYLKKCNNLEYLEKNIKIKSNIKISIISPVYNTGKFLLRLIKSIQYQNFTDLEIILIDDYSD